MFNLKSYSQCKKRIKIFSDMELLKVYLPYIEQNKAKPTTTTKKTQEKYMGNRNIMKASHRISAEQ